MSKDDIFSACIIAFLLLIALPMEIYIAACTWTSDAGALLGYYGSIFGGTITLGGVYWTIKNQEKYQKESLAMQYKPILEIDNFVESRKTSHVREIGICVSGLSGTRYTIANENNLHSKVCNIIFMNIGRGETSDGMITKLEIKKNAAFRDFIYPLSSHLSIGEILPERELQVEFTSVPFLLVDKDYFQENDSADLTTILHIEYNDIFNVYHYDLAVHLTWKILFDKNDYDVLYDSGWNAVAARCRIDVSKTQAMPVLKVTNCGGK